MSSADIDRIAGIVTDQDIGILSKKYDAVYTRLRKRNSASAFEAEIKFAFDFKEFANGDVVSYDRAGHADYMKYMIKKYK